MQTMVLVSLLDAATATKAVDFSYIPSGPWWYSIKVDEFEDIADISNIAKLDVVHLNYRSVTECHDVDRH
jgi:hypothetical protein